MVAISYHANAVTTNDASVHAGGLSIINTGNPADVARWWSGDDTANQNAEALSLLVTGDTLLVYEELYKSEFDGAPDSGFYDYKTDFYD